MRRAAEPIDVELGDASSVSRSRVAIVPSGRTTIAAQQFAESLINDRPVTVRWGSGGPSCSLFFLCRAGVLVDGWVKG